MDNKILEVLSEEIREIKNLTKAVRGEVTEVRKLAEAPWEEVRNSKQEITKSKKSRCCLGIGCDDSKRDR